MLLHHVSAMTGWVGVIAAVTAPTVCVKVLRSLQRKQCAAGDSMRAVKLGYTVTPTVVAEHQNIVYSLRCSAQKWSVKSSV
jgi:hypothetical protein